MSGPGRARVVVGVAAIALAASGVWVLVTAGVDDRAGSAGARIASGCSTEIEVSGGTRFVITAELDGPALAPPDSCVDVPAGRRAITAARVAVDGSDEVPVVPGDAVPFRLAAGRHTVTVAAEGAPGEAVVVLEADASQARADARISAVVLFVAASSLVALLPVLGRRARSPGGPGGPGDGSRPVLAVTVGPWAPPDAADRRG